MSMSSRLYERAQRVKHSFLERVSTWRARVKQAEKDQKDPPALMDALEPRLLMSGDVSGRVFLDTNGNGLFDDNEQGLSDWAVFVDHDGDGKRTEAEPFVLTGADGSFSFANLPGGGRRVSAEAPTGWERTLALNGWFFDARTGSVSGLDFGFTRHDQVIGRGDKGLYVFGGRSVVDDAQTSAPVETTRLDQPGRAWARWSYADLQPGSYEIFASWPASDDLATDAPFTIFDGHERVEVVRVDQTVAATDRVDTKGSWHSLGVFDLDREHLTVEVNQFTAFGKPIAIDALRVMQVDRLFDVSDDAPDTDATAAQADAKSDTNANTNFNADIDKTRLDRSGDSRARWQFDDLAKGQYAVYVSWTAADDLATDAPFAIYDGHQRIDSVRIDQTLTPIDVVDGDGNWSQLGVYELSGDGLTVEAHHATAFGKPVEVSEVRVVQLAASPIDPPVVPPAVPPIEPDDSQAERQKPNRTRRDQVKPFARVGNLSIDHGTQGQVDVSFVVWLSKPSRDTSFVEYVLEDHTKNLTDTKSQRTGVVQFDPGESFKVVTLPYGTASELKSSRPKVRLRHGDGVILLDEAFRPDVQFTALAATTGGTSVGLQGPTIVEENSVYEIQLSLLAGGPVTAATIDWGDGEQETYTYLPGILSHTYDEGTSTSYDIVVNYDDGTGAVDSDPFTVQVVDVSPTIVLTGAAQTDEGELYELTLDISDVVDDHATNLRINWGDGTIIDYAPTTTVAQHTYLNGPASHNIIVTWTDQEGDHVYGTTSAEWLLDQNFDADGHAEINAGGSNYANATAFQPDGKLVSVGIGGSSDFAIVRYLEDGSPDQSFGGGDGVVTVDISGGYDYAGDVFIETDVNDNVTGILVAGSAYGGAAVVRLDADGDLDLSFGGGDGIVELSDYSINSFYYGDLDVQADGKILIGGDYNGMSVARLNSDGSLDTTFAAASGTPGVVTTATTQSSWLEGMGLQSDGKIVLGGDASNGFVVTRVLADGTVDATFASGNGEGVAFPGQQYPYASGFEIGSNDRIVMTGNAYGGLQDSSGNYTETVFAMARFEADGDNDNTFGTNGVLTDNFVAGGNEYANGMILTDNDEILILADAKNTNSGLWQDVAVLYNADGTRQTLFDHDGAYFTGPGYGGSPITSLNGATSNADGDIVLVGQSYGGFAATRLTHDTAFTVDVDNVPPTLIFSGDAQVVDGSTYTLNLANLGPGSNDLTKWLIDWGDSSNVEEVAPTATFVTHDYIDGPGTYTITVTAEDVGNTYVVTLDGAPAALDVSLGTDGIVQEGHTSGVRVLDVAQQSDGKTVAAVQDDNGGFVLMRFNVDGSVDTSFGTGGRLEIDLGDYAGARTVAIQQDDKIVAAGFGYGAAGQDIGVVRLNADGSADATFGNNDDGVVIMDVDGYEFAQDIGIQSDGSIVIASYGGNSSSFVVTQLDTTGHIDQSFGTNGSQFISLGAYGSYVEALVIENDDQIVLVGTAYNDVDYTSDFAIARLNANGQLDTSFGLNETGNDGKIVVGFTYGGGSAAAYDNARDVTIQNDGSIVIVGDTYDNSYDFALVRLTSDGRLDQTFGTDGRVKTDLIPDDDGYGGPGTTGGYSDCAEAVAIQSDGKIVVAGSSYNPGSSSDDFVVARYNSDGDLDLNFDDNGYAYTDIGGNGSHDEANALLIQSNHRILMAGSAYGSGGQTEVALTRHYTGLEAYEIEVTDPNAPAITASGPSNIDEGALFTLNLSTANFTPTTWFINWGDGSNGGNPESVDGTETQWTHQFADGPEGHLITVTATDGTNTLAAPPIIVGVLDVAPTVSISGSAHARRNSVYRLDLSSVDPGADLGNDTIDSWTIDWGDNSTPQLLIGNPAYVEHTFDTLGQYTITATADDANGTYSTNDWVIDTIGQPALTFSGASEVDEQATYTLTLTYDDVVGIGMDDWLVNWGDGTGDHVVTATGETTIATYVYLAGPANHTITVQGRDSAGTYVAHVNGLGPAGSLDETLDGDGDTDGKIQHVDISSISARDVALQSDGKMVVAIDESSGKFVIMRFHTDGSLDTSFGTNGRKEVTEFTGWSGATSVSVQSDDKIVAVGYADGSIDQDTAVVRLNADGSNDTTFGNLNGTLLIDVGGYDSAEDVAIVTNSNGVLTQGHIAITSYGGSGELNAVLLDETGTAVNAFGTAGIALASFGNDWAYATALAIHDEGVVVVGGVWNSAGGSNDFAVVRFDESGNIDADFNSGNALTIDFAYGGGSGGASDYANDVAVDSEGNIIIAGTSYGYSSDFALARIDSDGILDSTFGPDPTGNPGRVTTDFISDSGYGGYSDYTNALALQSDGKIVVGGYSYNPGTSSYDFAIARYDISGNLDVTFDGKGYTYTNIDDAYGGSGDYLNALIIQPDQRILAAGYTYGSSGHSDIALARYGTGVTALDVTVNDVIADPLVAVSGPTEIDEGALYVLTLDPMETEPATWTIDWGDGEIETVPGSFDTATHQYDDSQATSRTIQVSANTTVESHVADPITVTILDVAPTLSVAGPAASGVALPYHLSLDFTDPGVDPITNWTVNWGDGVTDSIDIDPATATYPMVVTHTYDTINTFNIQVSATNDDGTFNADQKDITVSVVSASIAGAATTEEGAAYALDLSTTGLVDDVQWEITWGDGSVEMIDGNPDQVFHVYEDGPNNFDITAKVFRGGVLVATPSETISVQVTDATPSFALTAAGAWATNVDYEIVLEADNPGSDTIDWFIDWGDGQDTQSIALSGDHLRVTHQYAAIGNYTVTVTPSETPSGSPTTTYADMVHQVDVSEIVIVGNGVVDETSAYELQIIVADALRSTLTDIEVVWDYDGTQTIGESVGAAAYTATHTYPDELSAVTIKVLADNGTVTFPSNDLSITVADAPPTFTYDAPARVDEGSPYAITVTAENLDGLELDQWTVDWGDGTPEVFDHVEGTTVYPATLAKSQPYADGPNDYQIRVSVTDINGDRYYAGAASSSAANNDVSDGTRTFGLDATEFQRVIRYNDSIVTVGSVANNQTSFDFGLTQSTIDAITGEISSAISVTADLAGGSDYAKNVIVQQVNGVDKFLLVGYTFNGFDYDVSMVRFNLDGTLDDSFNPDAQGNGGRVVTNLSGHQYAYDVAVDGNGAIYAVGSTFENGSEDVLVLKYDENGIRDESFNAQGDNTHTVTDLGGDDTAYAVEVDSLGRLVIAGGSRTGTGWNIALARYLSDGTLDSTFGGNNDGTVIDDLGLGEFGAVATNLASVAGGYVIAGHTETEVPDGDNAWFALQVDANGSAVESFGASVNSAADDGTLLLDIGAGRDEAYGFDVTDDGHLLLSGTTWNSSSLEFDLAVVRVSLTGELDGHFAAGGVAINDWAGIEDRGHDAVQLADGRIYMVTGSAFADQVYRSAGLSNDGLLLASMVRINNVSPVVTLSGSAGPIDEFTNYSVSLSQVGTDPGADTISEWLINWGDGTVEAFTGQNHQYEVVDPNALTQDFVITAAAIDDDGTYSTNAIVVTVNNLSPTAPKNLTAVVDDVDGHDVDLSWEPALNATDYHIFRATDPDGPFVEIAGNEAPNGGLITVADDDLDPDTTYYYYVTAENNAIGQISGRSPVVEVTPVHNEPSVPENVAAVIAREDPGGGAEVFNQITLTWDQSVDVVNRPAEKYVIERSAAGGDFIEIGTLTGDDTIPATINFVDNNDIWRTRGYTYRITPFNGEVAGAEASFEIYPTPTVSIERDVNTDKLKLDWAGAGTYVEYEIYRSGTPGQSINGMTPVHTNEFVFDDLGNEDPSDDIFTAADTSWTDPDSTLNTVYYYKVLARHYSDHSRSEESYVTLATYETIALTADYGQLDGSGNPMIDRVPLSWNTTIEDVDYYTLSRDGTLVDFSFIGTQGLTDYTDQKIGLGTNYTYQVEAHGAEVALSGYVVNVETVPNAPQHFYVERDGYQEGDAKFTWSYNSDTTSYRIYKQGSGGAFEYFDTSTSGSLTKYIGPRPEGDDHVFMVRAVNDAGESPDSRWVTPAPDPERTLQDIADEADSSPCTLGILLGSEFVLENSDDDDGDGTVDHLDYNNSAEDDFMPLTIVASGLGTKLTIPSGLRVWTKSGGEMRALGTDTVSSGTEYTEASPGPLQVLFDEGQMTVYLEATTSLDRAPLDLTIRYHNYTTGQEETELVDTIYISTIPNFDADMASGESIVALNADDDDDDGIDDRVDGFNANRSTVADFDDVNDDEDDFEDLTIDFPTELADKLDANKARLIIRYNEGYNAADPEGFVYSPEKPGQTNRFERFESPPPMTTTDHTIRLWKDGASTGPAFNLVDTGGLFVAPDGGRAAVGSYTLADLGYDSGTLTLRIEGIEYGPEEIKFTLDLDGTGTWLYDFSHQVEVASDKRYVAYTDINVDGDDTLDFDVTSQYGTVFPIYLPSNDITSVKLNGWASSTAPDETVQGSGTLDDPYYFNRASDTVRVWYEGNVVDPNSSTFEILTGFDENDTDETRRIDLFVEGLQSGSETIKVYYKNGTDPHSTSPDQSISVAVVKPDLTVDSFNGTSGPNADAIREQIEMQDDHPGQLITVNDVDRDFDGIPDFADGLNLDGLADDDSFFSSDRFIATRFDENGVPVFVEGQDPKMTFVPITFELPDPIDLDRVRLRLDYAASDPSAVSTLTSTALYPPVIDEAPTTYTAPAGIRLWTHPSGVTNNNQRSPLAFNHDDATATGTAWYVPPTEGDAYYDKDDLLKLGFTEGPSGTRSVTLYVEAVTAGEYTIELKMNPDGKANYGGNDDEDFFITEKVKVTAGLVDLRIDSNNDGEITFLDEQAENTKHQTGKIIIVNDGDKNGNDIADFTEAIDVNEDPSLYFTPLEVLLPDDFDVDVAQLRFNYSAVTPGGISLTTVADETGSVISEPGSLRLWYKASETSTDYSFIADDTFIAASEFDIVQGQPLELYVEAIRPSVTSGDLEIKLSIDLDGADGGTVGLDHVVEADTIRLTAIQATNSPFSFAGVRLTDGALTLNETDLVSSGFLGPWTTGRTFTNMAGYEQDDAMGNGWSLDLPQLVHAGSAVILQDGGDSRIFDLMAPDDPDSLDIDESVYRERFGSLATLIRENGSYTLIETDGGRWYFNGFSSEPTSGEFKKYKSPSGESISADYDQYGQLKTITNGGDSFEYEYYWPARNLEADDPKNRIAGKLQRITHVPAATSFGNGVARRVVHFTYYTENEHESESEYRGHLGDLKQVDTYQISIAHDHLVDSTHYRYEMKDSPFETSRLKLVLGGDAYQMAAGTLSGLDEVVDMTNADLEQFADVVYTYDESTTQPRVKSIKMQGAGGTATKENDNTKIDLEGDTSGFYTLTYGNEEEHSGANLSRYSVTLAQVDDPTATDVEVIGASTTTYLNVFGQVLVSDTKYDNAAGGEAHILTANKFDKLARLAQTADPLAVASYTPPSADDPLAIAYQPALGAITQYHYADATTATATDAGSIAGLLKEVTLQQGAGGNAIRQQSLAYFKHEFIDDRDTPDTEDDLHIFTYPIAIESVYTENNVYNPADDAANREGEIKTTYAYDSNAYIESMPGRIETTLPAVTEAQNGDNTVGTIVQYFDQYGRITWTKDAGNILHFKSYDDATNIALVSITDFDPAKATSLTPLPEAGWASLHTAGTFEHYKTKVTAIDIFGDIAKIVDPSGRITSFSTYDQLDRTQTTVSDGVLTTVTEFDRRNSIVKTTIKDKDNNVVAATRVYLDLAGRAVYADRYLDFSTSGPFQSNDKLITKDTEREPYLGHYYRDVSTYNELGQNDRMINAVGTITRYRFDKLGQMLETWVGTDDRWGKNDAWKAGPAVTQDANMALIASNTYDARGQVATTTLHPSGIRNPADATHANRRTDFLYDFRGQLISVIEGAALSPTDINNLHPTQSYIDYDNLGRTVAQLVYDRAGLNATAVLNQDDVFNASTDTWEPAEQTNLRSMSAMNYDSRSQVYQSFVFNVEPDYNASDPFLIDGAKSKTYNASEALVSGVWYDQLGRVIKQHTKGQAASKTAYDHLGRPVTQYITDAAGDPHIGEAGNHAAAANVAGDHVLVQVYTTYDNASNPTLTAMYERRHDFAGTGALDANPNAARISYVGNWYDDLGRPTSTINYGTNGGAPPATNGEGKPERPSTPPKRVAADGWDLFLRTDVTYDAAGNIESQIDPRGIKTKRSYDALSRVTELIEAYIDDDGPRTDANRTVRYAYDGSNHVIEQTHVLTGGKLDVTRFLYGSTYSATGTQFDIGESEPVYVRSLLFNNDLLWGVQYGAPSSTSAIGRYENSYYNALGEQIFKETSSTTVKKEVPGALALKKELVHIYKRDGLGRIVEDQAAFLKSNHFDETVDRQSVEFDAFGRPFRFSSKKEAAVRNQVVRQYNGFGQLTGEFMSHEGVASQSSPHTIYAYAGPQQGSRLQSLTYPVVAPSTSARTLTYNYAGINDAIGRISSISDSVVGNAIESYTYLGMSTIVDRYRNEPDLNTTIVDDNYWGDLATRPDTNALDSGNNDIYSGLDRFGRPVDFITYRDSINSELIDRFQYGYDASSNRLYKRNLINENYSELYQFDNELALPKLNKYNDEYQASSYDALNRLTAFQRGELDKSDPQNGRYNKVEGDDATFQSWSLDERGSWTYFNDGERRYSRDSADLKFSSINDAAGNTTYFDTPGVDKHEQKFDAWNRLAESRVSEWSTREVIVFVDPEGGGIETATEDYLKTISKQNYKYDALGRLITETWDDSPGTKGIDFYHSAAWQNLIERHWTKQANGTIVENSLRDNVWSMAYVDALVFQERNSATPERFYAVQDANWNVTALLTKEGSLWTGVQRFVYDPYGRAYVINGDGELERIESTNPNDWSYFHQGGYYSVGTGRDGLYHFRHRSYNPRVGRWLQRDPAGFVDGLDLHEYVGGNPVNRVDPRGEAAHAVVGAAVGGVIGGLSYLYQSVVTGEFDLVDFGLSVGGGAVAGAVAVGTFGLGLAVGKAAGVGFGTSFFAAGAASGYTSAFSNGLITTGSFEQAHQAGAFGALTGGLTGPLGYRLGPSLRNFVISGAVGGGISGGVEGGIHAYYQSDGDWGATFTGALQRGAQGAAFGALGGGLGYYGTRAVIMGRYRIGAYKDINSGNAEGSQAHHLNQDRIFGGPEAANQGRQIRTGDGLSIVVEGRVRGTPHNRIHARLRELYRPYRPSAGPPHGGSTPSLRKYVQANEQALVAGGLPNFDAWFVAGLARNQAQAAGYRDSHLLPMAPTH